MKNSIKTTILSFILLVCIVGVSCSSCNVDVVGSTNSSSSTITGTYSYFIEGWITDEEARATVTPSADQVPATYDAADFVYDASEYTQVEIDLSTLEGSYANGDITIEVKAKKTTITLGNSAKYNIVLSGASEVGVTIASDYDFVLTLDNVAISSKDGSDEQALKTKGSATCFLVLVGESTLTGCTDESGETNTNAVKAGGSLVVSVDGVLNVVGNTKHGIVSDDVVYIQSGTVNVTLNPDTSAGTGIKPVNGYVQNGGTVNITALNMTQGSENKGIKVDGDEDETEYGAGKGYILINGGELAINTSGKGMSAGFDPTEDGDTTSSTYDPSVDVLHSYSKTAALSQAQSMWFQTQRAERRFKEMPSSQRKQAASGPLPETAPSPALTAMAFSTSTATLSRLQTARCFPDPKLDRPMSLGFAFAGFYSPLLFV